MTRIRRGLVVVLVLLAACTRAPEAGKPAASPEETAVAHSEPPAPPTEPAPVQPEPEAAPIDPASPTNVVGRVDEVEGDSYVWQHGQRAVAETGASLVSGDKLETGARGKIRVILVDESILSVGSGTSVELSDLQLENGSRSGRINVILGKFWMQITKWTGTGSSRYDIATPNAVAGVRGTTLWGDTQVDAICALEGTVEVRSLKKPSLKPASLAAGNCASALSEGKLAPMAPTAEQIKGYLDQVLIRH